MRINPILTALIQPENYTKSTYWQQNYKASKIPNTLF